LTRGCVIRQHWYEKRIVMRRRHEGKCHDKVRFKGLGMRHNRTPFHNAKLILQLFWRRNENQVKDRKDRGVS